VGSSGINVLLIDLCCKLFVVSWVAVVLLAHKVEVLMLCNSSGKCKYVCMYVCLFVSPLIVKNGCSEYSIM
jgi:hypothetical protein